jgi:hypothetical protein
MDRKYKFKIESFYYTKKYKSHWALVTHTCNPNYSRGRDQKDQFEASLGK